MVWDHDWLKKTLLTPACFWSIELKYTGLFHPAPWRRRRAGMRRRGAPRRHGGGGTELEQHPCCSLTRFNFVAVELGGLGRAGCSGGIYMHYWGMQTGGGAAASHEWQQGGLSELDSSRQQEAGRLRASNKPGPSTRTARARTHVRMVHAAGSWWRAPLLCRV